MALTVKCSLCSNITPVILLLLLTVAVQTQDDPLEHGRLRNLLEQALLNITENIDALQEIYFNPSSVSSPTSVCLRVVVCVHNIKYPDYSGSCSSYYDYNPAFRQCNDIDYCYCDPYDWYSYSVYELKLADDDKGGTSQISDLLTTSGITGVFYAFDPTFYHMIQALSVSIKLSFPYFDVYNSPNLNNVDNIYIHISEDIEGMPCWSDVDFELRMVLVWAKAFARAGGPSSNKLEMDRSSVSNGRNITDYYTWYYFPCSTQNFITNPLVAADNSWALILGIFMSSNLLLLSAVILYFRKMFLWLQQQGERTTIIYKASAVILTCVNIIVLMSDITFLITDTIKNLSEDALILDILLFLVLPAKAPLVLFILIIETPIICFNTSGASMEYNKKRYRIAHAFALCQIIWFVHRLVTDAIISVVFFVIAPAQTLGVVTLLLSVIASAVAFVAIIMHKGFTRCNKKACTFLFWASFNGVLVCGLLFLITMLFIVFVDNGLSSAGMGGLILSLLPPFAVFIVGLIVNQKYLASTTRSGTASIELQETSQSTAIQIDDNEGPETSQQPLLRRVNNHN